MFTVCSLKINIDGKNWLMKGFNSQLNFKNFWLQRTYINGILLPKLFWPTVRIYCSSDREKLLKFEAEGWEFAKFFRSLEQIIQAVKGQNNFW